MMFTAAMVKVCELHESLGLAPLSTIPGCWEHQVNADWRISVNGHPQPEPDSRGDVIPPWSCLANWRDTPVLLCDPGGGAMMGSASLGASSAEDDFIAAITKAIEERKAKQCP